MTHIERYLASVLKSLHEDDVAVLDDRTKDIVQLVTGAKVEGPFDESEAA